MQLNALSQDYFSSEAHPSKNWFDIHESIVVMMGQWCYVVLHTSGLVIQVEE